MNVWRWRLLGLALAALACGPSGGPVDADGDGVEREQDCDDGDPAVWQTVPMYVDADGDGFGSETLVDVCVGYATPAGFTAVTGDCDDGDAGKWELTELYPDGDGDQVGAGAPQVVCRGQFVPDGWALSGDDCAPDDGLRWRPRDYAYRDADGDGQTTPEIGSVCSGDALPAGYSMVESGPDCDDSDRSAWAVVSGYRDEDGDGVGAGPRVDHCTAGALPTGWVSIAGDCAPSDRTASVLWSYEYRDADGDGATVYAPGQVCVAPYTMPPGYSNWVGARGSDCDDGLATAWRYVWAYADADRDGVGAGGESICTGDALPEGWVQTTGDCAPDDPERWASFSYSYRDADGDGSAVYSPGSLCIGAAAPRGYLTSPTSNADCDDQDATVFRSMTGYADEDRDGVGAGPAIVSCTAGALPPGQQPTGTDCAPADASRWQSLPYVAVDQDRDGVTAPATGAVCTGTALPAPYYATAHGNDCDDGDPTLYRWVVLYPDHDGDGIGAPPRVIPCLGAELPAGLVPWGWDPDDGDPRVQAQEADPLDSW